MSPFREAVELCRTQLLLVLDKWQACKAATVQIAVGVYVARFSPFTVELAQQYQVHDLERLKVIL